MPESLATEPARSAAIVVSSLDSIFEYLILSAPTEGAGWDIPMTFPEVRAAKVVPPTGSISMRCLADVLQVPVSTATHLIDRLVAKGVVVRVRPKHDRRLVLVELSEQSRVQRDRLFRHRVELIETILAPLSPAAREQVAGVLSDIARSTHLLRQRDRAGVEVSEGEPDADPHSDRRS